MDSSEGSERLAGALTLPAWVLNRYHRGFLRMATREDSSALDDLVADGVVKLIELDGRLPAEVSVSEFRARAIGHLLLYYRARYRKFVGLYRGRGKPGEDRKRVVPVRHALAEWSQDLCRENDDVLLLIEIEDFVENYECPYPCPDEPGIPSPSPSSSAGASATRSSGSKRRPEERSPGGLTVPA